MSKATTPFQFILGDFKYHTKQADKVDSLYEVHSLIARLLAKKSSAGRHGFSPKVTAQYKRSIVERINWLVLSVEIAADLGCSDAELRKLVAAIEDPDANHTFRVASLPSWTERVTLHALSDAKRDQLREIAKTAGLDRGIFLAVISGDTKMTPKMSAQIIQTLNDLGYRSFAIDADGLLWPSKSFTK